MSSHCGKYPGCGCPPEIGYCPNGKPVMTEAEFMASLSQAQRKKLEAKELIIKTDGNCDFMLVDNPDRHRFTESGYHKVKNRSKGSNFTKPKKKRKK